MYLWVTYLPGSVASPYHPPSFPAIGRLPISMSLFAKCEEKRQWLDRVVGAVGIGHFFILFIMASNLGAAKSIAPCEVMEPGKHVTYK